MLRAVAYLRVSTAAQSVRHGDPEGYSLPTQREAILAKAQELGAAVIDEYIDRDTGTSTAKRAGMQALLARVEEQRDIDLVIVFKLDRWARQAREDLMADFVLETSGARLVSCSENIDRTAAGRLVHTMLASVNEYQSRNMSDDIKRKTLAKVKAGGTVTKAPIGYRNVHDKIDVRYVVIDEERALHIVWTFEEYATGEWTTRGLRDALEERGLRSQGNKRYPPKPLNISQVHRILTNPYYKGVIAHNGIEYEGRHEALISPELWQQVQDVLDYKRNGEKQREHPHYLKGTVYCGHCGSRLVVTHSKNWDEPLVVVR